MALMATYKDGAVTLDEGCEDPWWITHDNFDRDAFVDLVGVNIKGLDSEKRAEHLTELQEFIVSLQLEALQGRNEELLQIAQDTENAWKDLVIEGIANDETNAAKILEREKDDLEFEPMLDASEFADWFSKAEDEGKSDMILLLEKALKSEGIPDMEKDRIAEMIRVYSS